MLTLLRANVYTPGMLASVAVRRSSLLLSRQYFFFLFFSPPSLILSLGGVFPPEKQPVEFPNLNTENVRLFSQQQRFHLKGFGEHERKLKG